MQKNGNITVATAAGKATVKKMQGKKMYTLEPVRNRFPRTGSQTGEEISGSEPDRGEKTWNRVGSAGYSWNRHRILPEPVLTGFSSGYFFGSGSGTGPFGHLYLTVTPYFVANVEDLCAKLQWPRRKVENERMN